VKRGVKGGSISLLGYAAPAAFHIAENFGCRKEKGGRRRSNDSDHRNLGTGKGTWSSILGRKKCHRQSLREPRVNSNMVAK